MSETRKQSWLLDQLTKSEFFHQKLHSWALLATAKEIEAVKGETIDWNHTQLNISAKAWNRIIHRGVKPVIVFAHPNILQTIPRATAYYRMLAMVSQKSMNQIGLPTFAYENGRLPSPEVALNLTQRLNQIISVLVESDEALDPREFDIWRGMAAGSQAQGSWQNKKGQRMESVVAGLIQRRLQDKQWQVNMPVENPNRFTLHDGRVVEFADEPDIAFYQTGEIIAAVEVKGGIDPAGTLERIGAAIKSLHRAKIENPRATTILLLTAASLTGQAEIDLAANKNSISHWFSIEQVLQDDTTREKLFSMLRI